MLKIYAIFLCLMLLFGCKTTDPNLTNTLNKKPGKQAKIKNKEGNNKSCPTFGGKSKCK
jgi:energy-converting hydrogenase Eha subunit F